MLRSWLFLVTLVVGCAASGHRVAPAPAQAEGDGPQLWVQVAGDGDPTVVFDAGSGEDSSVWANIEPEVRQRIGVRTVVYDRAGLGKSAPAPGAYRIDDEAAALRHALDRFGVRGSIVLVAHAYGGFVATLVAASDPRVVGVVFVDADLPEFFDDAEIAHLQTQLIPKVAELARSNPALAHVMMPLVQAYPDTVKRVRAVTFPPALPVIDIVAEHSWDDTEDETAAMRRVHAAFVAASPAREAVLATGSGTQVIRDRPDVVLDAIARIVQRSSHAP
jgi:pimeloyl-ACP methyl ester carboxylesterase